eukprot:4671520-Prymnesium_polylepis.1
MPLARAALFRVVPRSVGIFLFGYCGGRRGAEVWEGSARLEGGGTMAGGVRSSGGAVPGGVKT